MAKQGSMIRDLIINVKASDLSGATKEAQKLIDALADSAAGAELLKAELNSTNTSLKNITRNASSAAKVFSNFSLNEKFKSSLNSILEGINRIKASAKDLNGLDIGINLKVDNLTKLQNDVSKSVQGLDISINIKSGNMKATNDRIQEIVNSLQDAAVGVELLNSQMQETSVLIRAIKTDATIAGDALMKVAISKNLEKDLDDVLHSLNNIAEEIVQLNLDTKDSFSSLEHSIDRVDDSLGAMASTLNRSRIEQKGTKEETKKLRESTSLLGSAYETLGLKIGKATEGSRNHTRIMGDLAKLAGPIPAAFAIISAHVWALTAAFDQLAQGDRLNRLEEIGTLIGANIGVPVQKVAAVMVDATNGAISYENALKKAANASAYGFSTAQLEKMTEVARRASVVMGVEMDDALNRIIRGVSKQEIELLDELGITVRLTEAQNTYAKSIGTTADKLSSYQKQTAYLNAVLAQSEKSFGFLSEENLNATGIEKLGAKFDSLANSARKAIAELSNEVLTKYFGFGSAQDVSTESTEAVIKGLESTLKSLDAAAKGNDLKAVSKLLSGELIDDKSFKTATDNLKKFREQYYIYKQKVDALKPNISGDTQYGLNANYNMQLAQYQTELAALENMESSIKEQENALLDIFSIKQKMVGINSKLFGMDSSTADVQKDLLFSTSEYFQNIEGSAKSTQGAMGNFSQSLRVAGKLTTELGDGFEAYHQSLLDISSVYDQLDNLEDKFPAIPKPVLDSLTKYADELARAAGFSGQADVQSRLSISSSYQQFSKEHQFDETKYSAQMGVKGRLSGENELDIARDRLAVSQQNFDLMQKVTKGETLSVDAAKQLDDAKRRVLEDQLALNAAAQTMLQTEQSISALNIRRLAAYYSSSQTSDAVATVENLKAELELLKANREQWIGIGANRDVVLELDTQIYEKNIAIARATEEMKLAAIDYKLSILEVNNAMATLQAYMEGTPTAIIESKMAQEALNIALERQAEIRASYEKGDQGTKKEDVVAADLAVENAKYAKVLADEAALRAKFQEKYNALDKLAYETSMGEAEILQNKLGIQDALVKSMQKVGLSQTEITNQLIAQRELEKELIELNAQRYRDMISGGIGAIKGENQMQYTSTAGMDKESAKLTQQSDGLANVANSFDQLAQYDQPFANVAANLSQMAIAIQDNASAMQIASIAGQAITSMFQMNGQAAIDSIDAQIAAEEKRDGKSAQSLAKIRALEAKKIETTRKTARQTIIMQTAVGVANALAMGDPFIGIPMAIAVAAMGMQALKAADSAAESSLAGLDSSEATGSLTLGDRTNRVDTAQTANAGEVSYIQGAAGTGSMQNFTPRASGGPAYAGHSYIVGEKGPELWTPKVDSTVSDAQSTRSGSSGAANVTLNIQALDARSFADLVYTDPQLFQNVVEMSLNQQGKTLG